MVSRWFRTSDDRSLSIEAQYVMLGAGFLNFGLLVWKGNQIDVIVRGMEVKEF
jgi:hypothetical protein